MKTENDELKRFSPTPDSEFGIPDGYFENLKFEIDRKICASRPINHKVRNRWIYATAASIVLLLGSAIYTISLKEINSTQKGVQLTNIAMDSNLHSIEENHPSNTSYPDATQITLSPENQDILDDELIAAADELNLSDEELVELTEYIDL
jgi:hypothetical protein